MNTIDTHAFWRYCTEGGVENAELALRFAAYLIGRGDLPAPARLMPSAGFWRGEPAIDDRPNAVVIFYRALVAGGDTAAIDALREMVNTDEGRALLAFLEAPSERGILK